MPATEKLNLYKSNKDDYVAPKAPVLVDVKPAQYLSIEGMGAPGGQEFQAKLGALYNVAFTIKMASKFAGRDYAVSMLEGIWWPPSSKSFMDPPKENWSWRLLIRTPEFIGPDHLKTAIAKLKAKEKPKEISDVKLETLAEGQCVQVLHVGAYDDEGRTLAAMHDFAEKRKLKYRGRHHEIYFSDPRRVKPEKMRTILRQPVQQLFGRDGAVPAH